MTTRKAIYQALLKAPIQILGVLSAVLGIVGSVWPEKVKSIVGGTSLPIQTAGVILLAIAAAYFLMLWLLKPGGGDNGPGSPQSTSGPQSPNFGVVHGPVTITQNSPESDSRRTNNYKLTDRNLDALERIARGVSGRPTVADQVLRRMREQQDQCPEMPIWLAVRKVAGRIGDSDEANGFPEARRRIRQAAVEGRLDIWGQQDIPPQHFQDERHKQIWTRITPDYWCDYELNILATSKENDDKWHTENEEMPGRRGLRYWSLRARGKDIQKHWPKPTQPNPYDDGESWKTI